jgi:hypothetical protein
MELLSLDIRKYFWGIISCAIRVCVEGTGKELQYATSKSHWMNRRARYIMTKTYSEKSSKASADYRITLKLEIIKAKF